MNRTSELLDAVDKLLLRFVAFPSEHDRHAVAAWVLHCWTLEAFDSTPRLAVLSPEKGSGKTRALEVLELVVPGAKHTVNMSAAALFRIVASDEATTLLMDEADTYLGWKVAAQHEDIRGLVNAGHRRGALTYRVSVEKGVEVQAFPAFAAVALAGIGDLPDTIIDRSVVIAMKRRAPHEHVEPFRRRKVEPITQNLRDALDVWGGEVALELELLLEDLELPDGVEDRAADVWEPLVAIGQLAGPPWSERLFEAAAKLNAQRAERDPSLGVQLLRDLRRVFDDRGVDRLTSVEIATALADLEGAPWSDLRGAPIDAHGIAKRLRPYGVRPGSHRFGDHTARGYLREDLHDAWTRYLPPQPRDIRDMRDNPAPTGTGQPPDVTDVTDVTVSREGCPPSEGCPSCGGEPVAFGRDGRGWCVEHNPHVREVPM